MRVCLLIGIVGGLLLTMMLTAPYAKSAVYVGTFIQDAAVLTVLALIALLAWRFIRHVLRETKEEIREAGARRRARDKQTLRQRLGF